MGKETQNNNVHQQIQYCPMLMSKCSISIMSYSKITPISTSVHCARMQMPIGIQPLSCIEK